MVIAGTDKKLSAVLRHPADRKRIRIEKSILNIAGMLCVRHGGLEWQEEL